MDPLSIISASVALAASVYKCAIEVRRIVGTMSEAPDSLSDLAEEVQLIQGALRSVEGALEADAGAVARCEVEDVFSIAVKGCRATLACIEKEFELLYGRADWRARFKVLWKEEDMKKLLGRLDRKRASIQLLLQLLSLHSAREVQALVARNRTSLAVAKEDIADLIPAYWSCRNTILDSLDKETVDSIYGDRESKLSTTEFDFDYELVNTQTYRRALSRVQAKRSRRQLPPQKEQDVQVSESGSEKSVEDLIDLSWEPETSTTSASQMPSQSCVDLEGLHFAPMIGAKEEPDTDNLDVPRSATSPLLDRSKQHRLSNQALSAAVPAFRTDIARECSPPPPRYIPYQPGRVGVPPLDAPLPDSINYQPRDVTHGAVLRQSPRRGIHNYHVAGDVDEEQIQGLVPTRRQEAQQRAVGATRPTILPPTETSVQITRRAAVLAFGRERTHAGKQIDLLFETGEFSQHDNFQDASQHAHETPPGAHTLGYMPERTARGDRPLSSPPQQEHAPQSGHRRPLPSAGASKTAEAMELRESQLDTRGRAPRRMTQGRGPRALRSSVDHQNARPSERFELPSQAGDLSRTRQYQETASGSRETRLGSLTTTTVSDEKLPQAYVRDLSPNTSASSRSAHSYSSHRPALYLPEPASPVTRHLPPLGSSSKKNRDKSTPPGPTEDAARPSNGMPSDLALQDNISEDISPVIIPTHGLKARKSQTSLLIEYFEGGKPSSSSSAERRPSTRVRLTPSRKSRASERVRSQEDSRNRPGTTRRIPLDSVLYIDSDDDGTKMGSHALAIEESNALRSPIDTDIDRSHRRRRPASPSMPSETRSTRSGAARASSINNPKLLETVEDAIRKLILPELSALKREQSKREQGRLRREQEPENSWQRERRRRRRVAEEQEDGEEDDYHYPRDQGLAYF